ncbi:MAG TPA: DUF1571 domain-containing protein [Gemmataceae bacterium]|jgi:hypothetical protein|nr:DUF1571 domain-containing protein [Gemmataceae bacterium]
MNDNRKPGARRSCRHASLCLLLAGLAAGTAATAPIVAPGSSPVTAAASSSPMDGPLRLLEEATRSYQDIRDYTCLLIKRERIRGQLQPNHLIDMKVRTDPFSVYLHWLGPQDLVGQEACYVVGRNNGMMRVHATGLRSIAGFVSLDPQDPRVMQNSRHAITDAGIGNLLVRYKGRWEMERSLNKTEVHVADYEYNKRKCTRVEMIHPDTGSRQYYVYRSVVYFDKQNHLPVRVENYDWPRQGGPPQGDLLESYSYVQLQFNVNLPDGTFNH